MTNSDFITSVLRLLGVLNEVDTASPEQGSQGLEALNELMAYLEQDGIDLQYYEQDSLTADLPIPRHARPAIKYRLAIAIAPEYGAKATQEMIATADEYYSSLLRQSVLYNNREMDLSDLPGTVRAYDITRG
jgi:hypothetical protein